MPARFLQYKANTEKYYELKGIMSKYLHKYYRDCDDPAELINQYLSCIIKPTRVLYIFHYPSLRNLFLENYALWCQRRVEESTKEGSYEDKLYEWGKTYENNDTTRKPLYRTANIPVNLDWFPQDWWNKYCWKYLGK